MGPERLVLANLNGLMMGLLLVGLFSHRRDRLCRSFTAYLVAVLLCDRLIVTWPETFYTARFWIAKEQVYWILKLAVSTEIGLLTFSRFPRARRFLAMLLLGLLILAAAAQLAPASRGPGEDSYDWVGVAGPRGQASLVVMMAGLVLMAAYYRVPLHPFHRSILLGLGLYLFVFTGLLTALRVCGSPLYSLFNTLDPAAYASSVGVWTWAAWRRAPPLTTTLQRLQPWASSSW